MAVPPTADGREDHSDTPVFVSSIAYDRVRDNGLKLKQTALATWGDVSITWADVSIGTGITSHKIWNGTDNNYVGEKLFNLFMQMTDFTRISAQTDPEELFLYYLGSVFRQKFCEKEQSLTSSTKEAGRATRLIWKLKYCTNPFTFLSSQFGILPGPLLVGGMA
ncbi:hypothetical protein DUI87_04560 [Hirundo rustica rustica]|uniref:Uncharacterized protein n=1 Tax=Hirundo rustica rustica TaxID=333673 RepID=A0A3M0L455_HIRRU|nr:hypothetical protein DUI87_04560 [Hirundo rustica rustica]